MTPVVVSSDLAAEVKLPVTAIRVNARIFCNVSIKPSDLSGRATHYSLLLCLPRVADLSGNSTGLPD
jgi:hypothetical protein